MNRPHLQADLEPIPYLADASAYYRCLRRLPHPLWLDSCAGSLKAGELDLLSAAPENHLTLQAGQPLDFGQIAALGQELAPLASHPQAPFSGGCIGYLSYEANHPEHGLPLPDQPLLPLLSLGVYTWALVQNHQEQRSWLVFHPQCSAAKRALVRRLLQDPTTVEPANFKLTEPFKASTSAAEFNHCIERIQDYIRAGDCYQVNFAQHFFARYQGDVLSAYLALRRVSPTPFAALLESDQGAALSLSPERFLQVRDNQVCTFPIKGTAPRSADPKQDRMHAERLLNSLKDRAENLMIVDLMRNDLSRVCEPGSVEVPQLFALRSFPTVHHLVSEVRGRLRADQSVVDLLRHCLPGGSITGAPKRRAMEVIDELEPMQRSLYCGSIFYWSACGNFDSSIAIRTLAATQGLLHCWGGGGITSDSDADQERQETLDKVQPLMQCLEANFLAR